MNQIWAGHPGAQQLREIGDNSQVEVWTKPLGGGRTAALFINTQNKKAESEEMLALLAAGLSRSATGNGNLQL